MTVSPTALLQVFFLIFSILAMDLWMGLFKQCRMPPCATEAISSCEAQRLSLKALYNGTAYMAVVDRHDCLARGGLWENPGYSFDNVGCASPLTRLPFCCTPLHL